MPLFTLAIPVYNNEKIGKCIDSILNQKFDDYEVIIINDGSTDETEKVIKSKIKNRNNVQLLNFKNGGLATARNRAIAAANGEYLWMIDSDDYIKENALELLHSYIKKYKYDIVFFDYLVVNEDEKKIKNSFIKLDAKEMKKVTSKNSLLDAYMKRKVHSYAWGYVARKNLYDNIVYPDGQNYEDLKTSYKIFEKINKLGFIDERLYYYVQTSGSITHTVTKSNIEDFYNAGKEMCMNLKNYNDLEKKVEVFYVGILLNCYYNMLKVDVKTSSKYKEELMEGLKKWKVNYFELLKSPYWKKFILVVLGIK